MPVDEARQIHAARSSDAVELLLVPGSHDDYGDVTRQVGESGKTVFSTQRRSTRGALSLALRLCVGLFRAKKAGD